jgi:hypothetical protein
MGAMGSLISLLTAAVQDTVSGFASGARWVALKGASPLSRFSPHTFRVRPSCGNGETFAAACYLLDKIDTRADSP